MFRKSPLAIAVLLIAASPAMADNFSQQTQAGTANKAVVEQLGGRSSANQDQNGERNRATVSRVGSVSQTQVGSFNRLDADQYLAGRGSQIRQVQDGHANEGEARQVGGQGNSIRQIQDGHRNDTSVVQLQGTNNSATTRQQGSHN